MSIEKPLHARLVSRFFATPRSQGWAKRRNVTSDAIQEVQWISRLSKHIYLRGKDLFINLWIDASPIWNEICLKEKKNTKQNKSCLQHEAWLRIKTESPNAYYDNLMDMFECSQKSSDNLPAPTPHPAPHRRTVLFSNSGGQWLRLWGIHGDRFLITVLIDPKIKIPVWYCLEDEAVMLFDSYLTLESKLGWHRLFLTVESTRGIRTLVVVFELLEEMVAWGW